MRAKVRHGAAMNARDDLTGRVPSPKSIGVIMTAEQLAS
jgi:hypothetical protein